MAKKQRKTKNVMGSPLIQGGDLPLCIVRPMLVSARQDTPDYPEELVRAILASVSLGMAEMQRVFNKQLSDYQIYVLSKTFADERHAFEQLLFDESTEVITLQAKMLMEAFLLSACRGHAVPLSLERALIARIVKRVLRRGMSKVLNNIPSFWWTNTASPVAILVWRHAFPPDHVTWLRSNQFEHVSQNEI